MTRDAVMKGTPGSVTDVAIDGGHTIVLLVARQPAGQRDPSMPEVKERLFSLGSEVVAGPPAQLGDYMRADMARMGKVIRDANIRPE